MRQAGGHGHRMGRKILRAPALYRGPASQQGPERVGEGAHQSRAGSRGGHEGAPNAERGPCCYRALD